MEYECSFPFSVVPKFILDDSFKDTITLKQGASQTVEVPFIAYPKPKSSVQFNGGAVRDAKRIKPEIVKDKVTLSFNKVQLPDAGEYVLTLANDGGKATLTVTLIVLGKKLICF